jgi:hypothetical protein
MVVNAQVRSDIFNLNLLVNKKPNCPSFTSI